MTTNEAKQNVKWAASVALYVGAGSYIGSASALAGSTLTAVQHGAVGALATFAGIGAYRVTRWAISRIIEGKPE